MEYHREHRIGSLLSTLGIATKKAALLRPLKRGVGRLKTSAKLKKFCGKSHFSLPIDMQSIERDFLILLISIKSNKE